MAAQLILITALFIVLWSLVFWTKDRVFRIVLIFSALLHGLLFVPPLFGLAKEPYEGEKKTAEVKLVPYSLFQGQPGEISTEPNDGDETKKLAASEEAENFIGNIGSRDNPKEESSDAISENVSAEKAVKEGTPVDLGLPEIKKVPDISFKDHPKGESYRQELRKLIKLNLEIPEKILESGYEGKQVVHFKLLRNGKLAAVFIDPKYLSENPSVNAATLDNIKRISAKFPPLPEGIKEDEVWFRVDIDYAK